MTKSEFVEQVASKADLDKKQAQAAVDAVLGFIAAGGVLLLAGYQGYAALSGAVALAAATNLR